MATHERSRNPHLRDDPPAGGDRFARESNTWRRMKPYQIWAAVAAAVAFVVGGLFLLY